MLAESPGRVTKGDALREPLKLYFALKGTVYGTTRHTLVNGDLALLILDWVIKFTDETGNLAKFPGTSTDVVRQGAHGIWRCFIDNPHNIK